jgi:hypothetical protein
MLPLLPKLARPQIKIIENFAADLERDWLMKLLRELSEHPSIPFDVREIFRFSRIRFPSTTCWPVPFPDVKSIRLVRPLSPRPLPPPDILSYYW